MGGHYNPEAEPKADQDLQALKDAQVPVAFRDKCAHLLVGLNKCRRQTLYHPEKCEHERHTYEECLYYCYLQRVELKKQEKDVMSGRKAEVDAMK